MIKDFVPDKFKTWIKSSLHERKQKKVSKQPKVDEKTFHSIIVNELGVESGDNIFIHSSIDNINLSFPFYGIFDILRDIIGVEGTYLFPTYPKQNSYEFLKSGAVFNIKKTPSFTGILNEFARRQKGSIRSLHPTKSVVANGPLAEILTNSHHESPFPYDINSPYYKFYQKKGKIIGIGVKTTYLSSVHVVDDCLKDKFPVWPYHDQLFHAKCVDSNKKELTVDTYAHDMRKMSFNLPKFFKEYINTDICNDITSAGAPFFRADAKDLLDAMIDLANDGITIYKKKHYK